jgi:hypothetical protein
LLYWKPYDYCQFLAGLILAQEEEEEEGMVL